MPEDLEVGVRFDTDQAVNDLEQDLEDAELTAGTDLTGTTGGGGGGDDLGTEAAFAGAEIGADVGTPDKGLTGILGGIGKLAGALLAIAGFLVLLEPIQETLGLLQRQFELFVVPFISALRPVLEIIQKAVVRLIQIFRNPLQFLQGLVQAIVSAIQPFVNAVINALNVIPGVNIDPVRAGGGRQPRQTGAARSTGTSIVGEAEQATATAGAGALIGALSPLGAGVGAIGGLTYYLLDDGARQEKQASLNRNRRSDSQ